MLSPDARQPPLLRLQAHLVSLQMDLYLGPQAAGQLKIEILMVITNAQAVILMSMEYLKSLPLQA